MENEQFLIEIDGSEVEDIYPDIVHLEVELDEELAAMFRLNLVLSQDETGLWNYLDDARFSVWKEVTIHVGFDSATEELITGLITHIKPVFDPDPTRCTLEIWGMDRSILMDQEEKLKDWPNKKDSDIAVEILQSYGFMPDTEDTEVIHDEAISTVIQRETDMQFLKRLALRNGFECYVEGTTGYFKRVQMDAEPQPLLAVHFGEETNVSRFSIEVNALTAVNVRMAQVDRMNKDVLEAEAASSQQKALGSQNAASLLGAGVDAGQVYIGMNSATGTPEMTVLCQELYHQGEWFVSGEGEIMANRYGHVLKPRGTVTIKGLGERHSGLYYVNHVTHVFTESGYAQTFKVKRNGLEPTGAENFSGESSGLLGGLL